MKELYGLTIDHETNIRKELITSLCSSHRDLYEEFILLNIYRLSHGGATLTLYPLLMSKG